MLYLTRLRLNPRSRQVQTELRNPYEMHRTLSKVFGDDPGQWRQARCLFRVEEGANANAIDLLVQARIPPDWKRLTVAPDYLRTEPEVKAYTLCLAVGQRLAFRLRANPTICRAGRRRALDTEAQQIEWLAAKGETDSFRLLRARTRGNTVEQFATADRFTATLYGVTFEGALQVTDALRFPAAVEGGIGSGKAFGFGLLSLARL